MSRMPSPSARFDSHPLGMWLLSFGLGGGVRQRLSAADRRQTAFCYGVKSGFLPEKFFIGNGRSIELVSSAGDPQQHLENRANHA